MSVTGLVRVNFEFLGLDFCREGSQTLKSLSTPCGSNLTSLGLAILAAEHLLTKRQPGMDAIPGNITGTCGYRCARRYLMGRDLLIWVGHSISDHIGQKNIKKRNA